MSVETRNPTYTKYLPLWKKAMDFTSPEDIIKSMGEIYLPKTGGQKAASNGDDRYKLYLSRARVLGLFPEIVNRMLGISANAIIERDNQRGAVIELPPKLQYMLKRATRDGLSLQKLTMNCIRQILITGRLPLVIDAEVNGSNPYIIQHQAKSLYNWRYDDNQLPEMMRFTIQENDVVDEFDDETTEVLKIFSFIEGTPALRIFKQGDKNSQWTEDLDERVLFEGDNLPVVVAGSIDLTPQFDPMPLNGALDAEHAYYRMSAGYHRTIAMTHEATPYTIGLETNERPTEIGSDVIWHGNKDAKFGYVEISGAGIKAAKEAMDEEKDRAKSQASKVEGGGGVKSAESLRLEQADRNATLQSVVSSAGQAIERSLKIAAEWVGSDPDAVIYQPNLDFSSSVFDASTITALNNLIAARHAPLKVAYNSLTASGLYTDSFEAYQQEIEEAEPTL